MPSRPVAVCWPLGRGFWDMAMLEHLFQNRWRPSDPLSFEHYKSFEEIPAEVDGVVVVLPARHCEPAGLGASRLTSVLARFTWVLVLATGDEESVFHAERVQHPNIKRWQFLPKPGVHDFADRKVINGYPTDIEMLGRYKDEADARPLDWFFSGQITHPRREQCAAVLRNLPNGLFLATPGFTQGEPHDQYFRHMASAKVVPCPSGAVMPDSFRVAEALEAGCIPVADGRSPHSNYPNGYWDYVLGEVPPFPVIEDWAQFPKLLGDLCGANWQATRNRVWSWWQQYKRKLAYALRDDILALRKETPVPQSVDDKITVLVPTSPIPSHPDTYKIDQVIASLRYHLPTSEIIILCDGPRPSVEHRRAAYEEYKSRLLWKAQHEWKNVLVVIFEESGDNHRHQSGIVKDVLSRGLVKTPLVLFNEHDAPLVTDPARPIDWQNIVEVVESDQARIVRLYYFEGLILPEHAYLFHGSFLFGNCSYVRTTQYSGWPHVTSTRNMQQLLAQHTPFRGKETMLETALYSPVQQAPWDVYRVVIYAPDGNMQRFVHTNGRGEGSERDGVDW